MTRRDLVVLAADKDMEHALRGLLSRHKSLPIRQIAFDIFVHPQHDAACAARGVPWERSGVRMEGRQSLPVPRRWAALRLTQMRAALTPGIEEVENQSAFD